MSSSRWMWELLRLSDHWTRKIRSNVIHWLLLVMYQFKWLTCNCSNCFGLGAHPNLPAGHMGLKKQHVTLLIWGWLDRLNWPSKLSLARLFCTHTCTPEYKLFTCLMPKLEQIEGPEFFVLAHKFRGSVALVVFGCLPESITVTFTSPITNLCPPASVIFSHLICYVITNTCSSRLHTRLHCASIHFIQWSTFALLPCIYPHPAVN